MVKVTAPPDEVDCAFRISIVATLFEPQPRVKFCGLPTEKVESQCSK